MSSGTSCQLTFRPDHFAFLQSFETHVQTVTEPRLNSDVSTKWGCSYTVPRTRQMRSLSSIWCSINLLSSDQWILLQLRILQFKRSRDKSKHACLCRCASFGCLIGRLDLSPAALSFRGTVLTDTVLGIFHSSLRRLPTLKRIIRARQAKTLSWRTDVFRGLPERWRSLTLPVVRYICSYYTTTHWLTPNSVAMYQLLLQSLDVLTTCHFSSKYNFATIQPVTS